MIKTKFLRSLGPVVGLILFLLALYVLHNELRIYRFRDIIQSLRILPPSGIGIALLLTAVSYFIMTAYDTLALRYLKRPMPYGKTALASFVSYAFSNNMGFAMLAGGSVRFRLYSTWGLSLIEISKIVLFCTATLWLGFLGLSGVVFLFAPLQIPTVLHLPFAGTSLLGIIALAVVGVVFGTVLFRKSPLRLGSWELPVPSPYFFGMQMIVAVADWIVASLVLYALLPPGNDLPVTTLVAVFLFGQLAGLASQIPGGLGIFETTVIFLLSPYLPGSVLLAMLLAYRGIYYLLPLLVAALLMGIQELMQKEADLQRLVRFFGARIPGLLPNVFSVTTFAGGVILLFSGSTPAISSRLEWLRDILPLPVLEISHFLGSVAGMSLLVLARGLQRRIDAAYVLTSTLLAAGVIFSLLKGFDYEEAIILTVMLCALLPCRRYFYRKSALLSETFTPGWTTALTMAMASSLWLVNFSYKHVEYSQDLWWSFTLHSPASRSLRGLVGAASVLTVIAIIRLLQPAPDRLRLSKQVDMEQVASVVAESPMSYANLALLGDKNFLFNDKRNAFIMYGIAGRSWVAMGDPIGPFGEWRELVWHFREMCDRYDGWPVFYEVGPEALPLYLDLGLVPLKIGEEGRVLLEDFSL
ncbi:MAG: phosphatidylglycerol lysyltransferase domain-containing protein, partial [Smithellaceae bacterium]|nr:phosphatidylglycerol lysyltransferase domain-containing protein [Smithellaceae bacterium]